MNEVVGDQTTFAELDNVLKLELRTFTVIVVGVDLGSEPVAFDADASCVLEVSTGMIVRGGVDLDQVGTRLHPVASLDDMAEAKTAVDAGGQTGCNSIGLTQMASADTANEGAIWCGGQNICRKLHRCRSSSYGPNSRIGAKRSGVRAAESWRRGGHRRRKEPRGVAGQGAEATGRRCCLIE